MNKDWFSSCSQFFFSSLSLLVSNCSLVKLYASYINLVLESFPLTNKFNLSTPQPAVSICNLTTTWHQTNRHLYTHQPYTKICLYLYSCYDLHKYRFNFISKMFPHMYVEFNFWPSKPYTCTISLNGDIKT